MIDRDDDVREESDDVKISSLEELELANTSYEEICAVAELLSEED